ncbi:unnamed protein product [Acanthoscelides obtectus]|uniref:Uncharacterized protein n=1 Tax=Acanthoscelides obtectus TaxID=200917 RepID=A0A9P0KKS6_ACAOB|nr:unnamed protein product [Acanthoscelides obtectus]CAK1654681.1 hypothetical protein AOBTE_LOCUS18765 [Acanthoscelides obtectus]
MSNFWTLSRNRVFLYTQEKELPLLSIHKGEPTCCLWTASVLLYLIEEPCDQNRDPRKVK